MPQSRWITAVLVLLFALIAYLIGGSIMQGAGINKIVVMIVTSIIIFLAVVLLIIPITEDRKVDPSDIGSIVIFVLISLFLIWGIKALGFVDSFPTIKMAIASIFPGGA